MHGHADRDGLDLERRSLRVRTEVRLRQDDHRRRAALPAEREVALEAPRVEVAVEPRDEEDDVDVRRDDLLDRLAVVGGREARELRPSRQHGVDERRVGRRDRDPVADRGQLAPGLGGVAEPAGELRRLLAARRVEEVRAPVLDCHARGLEAVGGKRGELVFEGWVPAERFEQRESPFAQAEIGPEARGPWRRRRAES